MEKTVTKKQINPALLIVDLQNRFFPLVPERDREFGKFFINTLIRMFRDNGLPVFRIYHSNKESGPKPGTDEFEYPTSINILPEDTMIVKSYSDSFNKTELDTVLKEKGCNTVFICGFSATGCVLATYIGAMNHDYKAFIVKDAIMSPNTRFTKLAEQMFDAINLNAVKIMVEGA
jgi:nicotinamidase-related amidase